MTTFVGARDALVTHFDTAIKLAYPGLPVFYENAVKADLDSVGDNFLQIGVDFTSADQFDFDLAAQDHMTVGLFTVRVFAKDGTGTRTALGMMEFITGLMKLKDLSGVHTGIPKPGRKISDKGWSATDLLVPFEFHSKY